MPARLAAHGEPTTIGAARGGNAARCRQDDIVASQALRPRQRHARSVLMKESNVFGAPVPAQAD
jgi:hypothetical protein